MVSRAVLVAVGMLMIRVIAGMIVMMLMWLVRAHSLDDSADMLSQTSFDPKGPYDIPFPVRERPRCALCYLS